MANAQEIALIGLAKRRGLLSPADVARLESARHQLPQASLAQLLAREQLPAAPLGELHRGLSGSRFSCACGYEIEYAGLEALATLSCPRCSGRLLPIQTSGSSASGPVEATIRETDRPRPPSERVAKSGRVGRMIGPYQLVRELGRGAAGVVFEAVRPDLSSRRFALKVLLDGTDDESVRRFKREANVAARLEDPGVVSVYDIGFADDRHYYAMEFVDGQTLRDRLSEGPLPVLEAVDLVRELARVMHLAHQHDITHRDLKPANVILVTDDDGKQRPRITDFGLARDHRDLMSSLSRTGDVFGTPLYMSPEQISGERVDARSDIYALGVILYEALLDKLPFYDADWVELAVLIRSGNYAPPSRIDASIPKALDAIVARAMALDPEDRYPTAGELEADLAALLASPPQRASSAPPPPLLLGIGAVAIALALVLIGLIVTRDASEPEPDVLADAASRAPNQRVSARAAKALTAAEVATAASDFAAVQAAIRAAEEADGLSPPVAAARQRLATKWLERARKAAKSLAPGVELRAWTAALWLIDQDPTGQAVATELLARAAALRKISARYESVDAFLKAAVDVRALDRDRREAIRIERIRLAYARGRFQHVVRLSRGLGQGETPAHREVQYLKAFAGMHLKQGNMLKGEMERLAKGSDLVAHCAATLIASQKKDASALSERAQGALQLAQAHPGSVLAALNVADCLTPLGRTPEVRAVINQALAANPDHWELHLARGRSLWLEGSRRDMERTIARQAYGRAVELTLPDGPFRRSDWIHYAILLLWQKRPSDLLALIERDEKRLTGPPATVAYFHGLRALAHFLLKDTKKAKAEFLLGMRLNEELMLSVARGAPSTVTEPFLDQIAGPILKSLGVPERQLYWLRRRMLGKRRGRGGRYRDGRRDRERRRGRDRPGDPNR